MADAGRVVAMLPKWRNLQRNFTNEFFEIVCESSFIFALIISCNETESTLTKMLLFLFPAGNVLLASQVD